MNNILLPLKEDYMGLGLLIKNLRYLMRFDLKKMYKDLDYAINAFDYMKYEIKEDINNILVPQVLSKKETVDYIIKNRASIARYGDGEVRIMRGEDSAAQKYNPLLAKKLVEILCSDNNKIKIGICSLPGHSLAKANSAGKIFVRKFWGAHIDWFFKQLKFDKQYLNAEFTILPGSQEEYNQIRQIWQERDIVVVSGDRVFKHIQYNIFDNAKTVEYIKAPTVNAFNKYNQILNQVKRTSKEKLIVILLGPTATVMAYDLANIGYQALDLGHIVKSYDAYKKGIPLTPSYMKKFFQKD